ncbi:hypothetical protein HHI36_001128, partial [Cryptolaemus montrouzieri]
KNGEGACAFRPIYLIPSGAKLFEKVIARKLEKQIGEKCPLSSFQFGFKKGLSAIGAVDKVKSAAKMEMEKPISARSSVCGLRLI